MLAGAGKAAGRRYGTLTASHRRAPDFLIVGAKRGGTTSLYEYLTEHPGVLRQFPTPNAKGSYFFDENWSKGPSWYLSHFPSDRTRERARRQLGYEPVAGEGSPYYLFHPLAPGRAAAIAPGALVVALLRHPVERAYSHWKERCRHTETLSFEDALRAEPERTEGEAERIVAEPGYVSFAHRHQSYLAQSDYGPMLRRWLEAFGPDRCVIRTAESFYADPQALLDEIARRLDMPSFVVDDVSPRNAAASSPMSATARRLCESALGHVPGEVADLIGTTPGWE